MHSQVSSWYLPRTVAITRSTPSAQTIDSFVAAMSSASTSGVNLAKAFFEPSGLQVEPDELAGQTFQSLCVFELEKT